MNYFGMTSLTNPTPARRWSTSPRRWPTPNVLADVPAPPPTRWPTRVGWFGLNNINCGLLGMPLGFLVIYVVSLMTKAPSMELQGFIDEIRKPRGRTIIQEKD